MTGSLDSCVGGCGSIRRKSSIPIRSIYLQSSELLDASITTNRPSTSFSLNTRWKIDKLPTRASGVSLNPSAPVSNWRFQSWTYIPRKDPLLSLELRAGNRGYLMDSCYYSRTSEYRRLLKWSWFEEGFYMSFKGSIGQLESKLIPRLCNNLTSLYWMPSPEFDGSPLPLLPFGCIFNEWFKYHDSEPDIEFGNFFAHLVRVYNTIQGTVEAHKTLCTEAALLLERINREAKEFVPDSRRPWLQPENFNLKPTYRAVILIMDRYDPGQERDSTKLIDLEEHSNNQTVLLVRTGDESHLSAPINFEALRANDLCLPLARTDVPAASEDVVRVSLANAVKFVADLQQREDSTSPQHRTSWKRSARLNSGLMSG